MAAVSGSSAPSARTLAGPHILQTSAERALVERTLRLPPEQRGEAEVSAIAAIMGRTKFAQSLNADALLALARLVTWQAVPRGETVVREGEVRLVTALLAPNVAAFVICLLTARRTRVAAVDEGAELERTSLGSARSWSDPLRPFLPLSRRCRFKRLDPNTRTD